MYQDGKIPLIIHYGPVDYIQDIYSTRVALPSTQMLALWSRLQPTQEVQHICPLLCMYHTNNEASAFGIDSVKDALSNAANRRF